MNSHSIRVGCAGWSLSREHAERFAADGTHLQRYASKLSCVEINSSFYRPHRPQTYARWAASVPDDFRFSVKVPKQITHLQRLEECAVALDEFLAQCGQLGDKLGCLLVQLPPSLVFDAQVAEDFFSCLRERFVGPVVVEPRHPSWVEAETLLQAQRIAQAAVDPSRIATDPTPGGWRGFRYWRLHGSPRIYHDAYDAEYLSRLRVTLAEAAADAEVWCVFDNTASGAALANALDMRYPPRRCCGVSG
ncbi:DUF72 domain-containing protein [Pseudomonas sp. CFBP 8771]|uniref:DUF72 domain-containing protein n=1 Tax=Pseudomonas sp. CFBP 8771 TaxID=2775285 RepID=UPI0017855330|nr:DUF72 domain-containing protein [Pseudomonas sp. CFBP 8771]MBD8602788.1 DUF72 domain-containing protein [Pseudomonas sp. CFBP 8771]